MRIGYVGKHDQHNSNDDEGAITHALQTLGHSVQRLRESKGYMVDKLECDFILFHKWADVPAMLKARVPLVFWYFDLVEFPDPTLRHRCQTRIRWMQSVVPKVALGFCTDGDWVDYYSPQYLSAKDADKLRWLTQGADGRLAGKILPAPPSSRIPILFTGGKRRGIVGESFVDDMIEKYGEHRAGGRFLHVEHGHYGEDLAALIGQADIVVAPDGPVTNKYWSNRVYLTLGFGGFLLHPRCARLEDHYLGWNSAADQLSHPSQIVYYSTRDELHQLVDFFTSSQEGWAGFERRRKIALAGMDRTLSEHLYVHRCAELIRTVRKELGI